MKRSYALEPVASDDFFETCGQPAAFKKLLFGLIYFHAAIQARGCARCEGLNRLGRPAWGLT